LPHTKPYTPAPRSNTVRRQQLFEAAIIEEMGDQSRIAGDIAALFHCLSAMTRDAIEKRVALHLLHIWAFILCDQWDEAAQLWEDTGRLLNDLRRANRVEPCPEKTYATNGRAPNSPIRHEDVVLLEQLTSRERQILGLIARGASNKEIADQLVLSVGTVKGHVNHIFGKLDVHSRTAAVARARDCHLLASLPEFTGFPTSNAHGRNRIYFDS
jgi:ATP/maltotriose-dependent transcriptional regulator MalT